MSSEMPEPLWCEVVGDTEPWRRGRLFLVLLAVWQFFSHLLVLGSLLLAGQIELLLGVAVGAIIFWLSFYFIWTGVHWVRWIAGGSSCLLGFARIIWGARDGNAIFLVDGTVAFVTGAYLALAPSVYFSRGARKKNFNGRNRSSSRLFLRCSSRALSSRLSR